MTETEAARIKAIQARADAATKGPWAVSSSILVCDEKARVISQGLDFCNELPELCPDIHEAGKNADFIAASRSDIPWLLDRLRAKDKAIEAAKALTADMYLACRVLHRDETLPFPEQACLGNRLGMGADAIDAALKEEQA